MRAGKEALAGMAGEPPRPGRPAQPRYGTKYGSFAKVPLPNAAEADVSRQRWMDFVRFNQEFFAGWHQMLADAVHAVAPDLPVHAKAMTWTMLNANDLRFGVDATLFGRLSQINGNDSVNFYDFDDGEFAQGWQLNAMALDLQRSVRNCAGLQHREPCHYGPRNPVRAGRAHSRGVVAGGRTWPRRNHDLGLGAQLRSERRPIREHHAPAGMRRSGRARQLRSQPCGARSDRPATIAAATVDPPQCHGGGLGQRSLQQLPGPALHGVVIHRPQDRVRHRAAVGIGRDPRRAGAVRARHRASHRRSRNRIAEVPRSYSLRRPAGSLDPRRIWRGREPDRQRRSGLVRPGACRARNWYVPIMATLSQWNVRPTWSCATPMGNRHGASSGGPRRRRKA